MKILAVDHGTTSGFTLLNDGRIEEIGTFKLEGTSRGAKLLEFYAKTNGLIHKFKPDIVAGEKPMHTRGGSAFELLAGFYCLLNMVSFERQIEFFECNPSMVKKHVTGKGNAEKFVVCDAIAFKYNIPVSQITENDYYKVATKNNQPGDIKYIHYDKSDSLALADWCYKNKKGGKQK